MLGSFFFMLFVVSADFVHNKKIQNLLSGTLSEYQTYWIQTRPDLSSNCLQRLSADDKIHR